MSVLETKINEILSKKNLSIYGLSNLIKYPDSPLYKIIKGEIGLSDSVKERLLPVLEVSKEEFESWIIADKYSKETIELAIVNKRGFPYKRKSLFTTKIDELLKEKNMSRTGLSGKIGCSQSGLNRVIINKTPLSENILKKLSMFFEVSENEILSWKAVDKYSIEALQKALNEKD